MIRANWHKLLLAAAAILTLFVVISVVLVSDRALEEPLPTLAPTWDAAQAGEAAVALNTTALPTPVPPEPTAVPTDTPTVAPTEPPTATATPTAEDTAAVPTQAPSATPLPPTQAPVQQPRVTVLQVSGGMPPAEPVPNVVVLRVEPAQLARLQADVRALGGTVEVVNPALGAVTVQLPDESAAEALSQTEYVQAAEPDYYVSAQITATDPRISEQWSLSAMNIPLSLPDDLTPIKVAVIDSGICADHPELAGKIIGGYDFIEGDAVPQDEMGHGCAVAGIIAANWDGQGMAGVAPNARLLIYRVLNAQGSGRYSNVASAIVRAVDDGAQIINLSLGGVNPSQLLQDAVDYAISRGVLVIAAAGNSGSSSVLYPAAYPNVVSVGALAMDGTRALFSNTGKVELWAPGVNVLSLTLANGHTTMSGTSFAAPNVAGLAALEMAQGRSLALGGNAGYGAEGEVLPIMTPTPLTSLRDIPSGVGRVEGWLAVQVGDHINRIDPARTAILLYSDDGFTYELQDVNGSVINYHNKRVAVVGRFSDQVSALSMESFGADAAIEVQLIDPLSEFNAQAVVGSKPFVNLLCRFNDITSGQRPVSYFTNMFANSYPGIDHYWRQVSFNQVNLSGTTTLNTWVTLPRPRASYMNGQNANLRLLARDCMSAADPYVNYNNYYGINMFFNDVLDCCAWGGSAWVNFDGLNTFKPTTWLPSWAHNYDVVVHEMGHAFGLPHSTGTASNRPSGMNIYVSRWDVMSAGGTGAVVSEHGALPIGTIGYHVDMLSWLSSSRKVTVGPGHALEVTLDRLINPTTSNPLLAILPINGSHNHFYTVEVRDIFAIYDQNVPARAVIIHRVDKTMRDNGGHAMVVDDDDDGDEPLIDSNDEGAQWQPGEYFFDSVNKIRIEVLASSGTTYRVRLSNRPVPPAKVNIVSAPAITRNRRPTVAWNSVPNADRYTVEFLMNNVIVHANTVTGTSYTPPGALRDGTYSVRVRALNALGQAGPNSAPRSVTIDTVPPANPQKVSPAPGAEVRTFTPTFCWQRVPDAAVYEVSWQPYQSARTTSTCYTMPRQLVEGQQWWNVIACDQAGNCGSWVDAFPYTIVSPTNSAPRVVRQGTNPRLTWNPQDWALGYEVQIATNSSFTALYGSYTLPADILSMTVNDMPVGTYYWRIRIKSGATTWSPWSQPEMIVVR